MVRTTGNNPDLWLASEWHEGEQALWGWALNLRNMTLSPGSRVSKLSQAVGHPVSAEIWGIAWRCWKSTSDTLLKAESKVLLMIQVPYHHLVLSPYLISSLLAPLSRRHTGLPAGPEPPRPTPSCFLCFAWNTLSPERSEWSPPQACGSSPQCHLWEASFDHSVDEGA